MSLRWTEPAAHDLTRICDYLETKAGPAIARRVALDIYQAIGSLAEFPHRGRPGRKTGTRQLVLDRLPYVVVYRIRDEATEILRILHGAQRWP